MIGYSVGGDNNVQLQGGIRLREFVLPKLPGVLIFKKFETVKCVLFIEVSSLIFHDVMIKRGTTEK